MLIFKVTNSAQNIVIVVNGADKGIEGILKTKGMGYRGAELKDLKFETKQNSNRLELRFSRN